jgi:hypothetical protein
MLCGNCSHFSWGGLLTGSQAVQVHTLGPFALSFQVVMQEWSGDVSDAAFTSLHCIPKFSEVFCRKDQTCTERLQRYTVLAQGQTGTCGSSNLAKIHMGHTAGAPGDGLAVEIYVKVDQSRPLNHLMTLTMPAYSYPQAVMNDLSAMLSDENFENLAGFTLL